MSTVDQVIDRALRAALAEVGYQRRTDRWNKYAAEIYPSVNRQPYCGIGATWAYYKAGADLRKLCWMPYVPYIEKYARKIGAWKTSGQKAGDLVIYDWGGDRIADHVGIAYPDPKAAGFRAVEFNTAKGSTGSQSNGGGVHIRYRGRKSIRGWVDIRTMLARAGVSTAKAVTVAASKASGSLDTDGILGARSVKELQARLGVTVDGIAGPATVKAMQSLIGAPYVDGKISRQSSGIATAWPKLYRGCYTIGSGGSPFVRMWQAYCGAKIDGRWGKETSRRTQIMCNEWASFATPGDRTNAVKRAKAGA